MKAEKLFIETTKRKVAYIRMGKENKKKLILIHGNVSGSSFYLPLMNRLKDDFDVIAPDLNGYGLTQSSPIKASSGLFDWAEDIDSLAVALGIDKFSLVGWSLGGGIAMRYAIEHSDKLENLILISPMSPYGFGGTYDKDGKLLGSYGLGSSGGFVNADFLANLKNKDRSDAPSTARDVMRKSYFTQNFKLDKETEDMFVDEIMNMQLGDDYYPGDYKPYADFPFVLPGERGINNTLAPKYANVSGIADIAKKPPILWFRGDNDVIVADSSFSDLMTLGKMGIIPNYPGEDKMPPQPMVSQTRYVLDKYKNSGGTYKEFLIENAGHSCHIEQEDVFVKLLSENI